MGKRDKEKKKCRVCGESKLLTEFYYIKKTNKAADECKECRSKMNKEYGKNNKEKIAKRQKRYKKKNKEKIRERNKIYYKNNKEEIRVQNQKWYRKNKKRCIEVGNIYRQKKLKEDIAFRIGKNISKAINQSLKTKNLSKNRRHWETLVGYTSQELKTHLESLFTEGMTWENYGFYGWHIDHVIPKTFFVFTSTDDVEFKYCWSLPNLQPLWAEDNLEKGSKIIY